MYILRSKILLFVIGTLFAPLAGEVGIEPTTTGLTVRGSNQLSYSPIIETYLAVRVGFEPTDPEGPPVFKTGAIDQLCHLTKKETMCGTYGIRTHLIERRDRPTDTPSIPISQ